MAVDKRVDLRVTGIQKPHERNEIFKYYAKRISSRIRDPQILKSARASESEKLRYHEEKKTSNLTMFKRYFSK